MIGCKICEGTGFDKIELGEPCGICGGMGNFLSEGEARFGDVSNWQWALFYSVPLLKVDVSHAVSLSGELGEFYSSDIVKPMPELSNIVKCAVEDFLKTKSISDAQAEAELEAERQAEACALAENEHYYSYFQQEMLAEFAAIEANEVAA